MSALEQFAKAHGFEYRSGGELEGPFSVFRLGSGGRATGIVRGALPDGRATTVAAYACTGRGPGGDAEDLSFTVAISELPETAATLPWLECLSREAEIAGGPRAEAAPGMREVPLESEFFEQRFLLLAGPGTDRSAVVELFAPSFLHWYAYEAPFGMTMELIGGRLCAYTPDTMERPGHLDSFWDSVATIAAQIGAEALEA